MNSIPDSAGSARRAWLRQMQEELAPRQSDFETSFAWRLAFVVAAIVVTINVLAPPPAVETARQVHARV
ncbi:hypothetical protein [Paraburkholderia nemoris]|uniref:hypothetical protein n=1 Tax=Paraburkholderia nemoris TaxID=2793076 RepID=UPI001B27F616|nr:hypothetical protein [Paraburkholderia nemoris]CAE6693146.1 hypothetical protein LMG22931_00469 [Paraburkholderia nemoris]